MPKTHLKGLDQVFRNLNKEVAKIEGSTLKGLIRAAVIVRRSMDTTSPKIPVDKGNLRSSYFVITSDGSEQRGNAPADATQEVSRVALSTRGPFIVMGFGANYAVYVHEMLGSTGRAKRGLRFSRKGIGSVNWNRPGSGPKFFENALDRNIEDVKDMLVSGLSYVFGTDLFKASMPKTPNDCVCLFDTGGVPKEQYGYEKPNLQVLLRNKDYDEGYAALRDIKYFLDEKNGETWNSTKYIIIRTRSDILYLGQDDKNRYQWSLNFQIHRSGI